MSGSPAIAIDTVILRPLRDTRLFPYILIALGALVAAPATGQPVLAALAVPFALSLALGLRRTGPVRVKATVHLNSDRVLEGDLLTGRVELQWDGTFACDIMLHPLSGVEPAPDGERAWSLPSATGGVQLPIRLRASSWGRHTMTEVWVRLERPFGLVAWTGSVVAGPTVRVLPGTERLSRLLDPADSRALMGVHRSRRVGDGGEFAQLRPYAPGDRLRDLNWGATARCGRPVVNRYHPEQSGEVVVVIDAFADGSRTSGQALSRAARAAWAVASVHLRANDRVGLAGLGGRTHWLPPAGGRLARYRLLDALLRIGGEATTMAARVTPDHATGVPSSALVVALTPLHDDRTVTTLAAWRGRGRSVAVIALDTEDLLDAAASPADSLARRIWRLDLERRRGALAAAGIPVVTLAAADAVTPVIAALRRARRAPTLRRAR